MASGIASTESGLQGSKPKGPAGKLVDYDRFIDGQLRRTRGQVKSVEIAQGLTTLAVGTLVFFLVAVALDHWLFRGGLGYFGRFVLFAGYIVVAAYYFALNVLPALVRRVNPVYAAQTIERAKPSLKNSLINFLLFRRQREAVPQLIYSALEEQAAAGLVQVPIDTAVDRTQVIHRGYALVALAAVFAIYFVISPKNPLVTIERLMLPWADIAAPARVSISDVQPGSSYAFRGVPLKVTAEIVGLPSGEQAKLLYTTADRQSVDRAIPMTVPPDGYRYTATLPEGDGGVQQDLQYHIVAGDAVSNTYRVTAVAMPTIMVDSVDYHYPDYTGMEPISIKHRGDLKALEGTQVTVHASANQPIRSASIDFNCDGKPDRGLKVDGQKATANFTLSMNNSRTAALFDSYQLQFTNDQNVQNPQPVRHTVEVVPDLPPEVTFLAPAQEEVGVPVNGSVMLEVRAIDPDYALASVAILAKTEKGDVLDAAAGELLTKAPHAGPFVGKYEFVPAKLGLHEGDVVRYQAVAMDNKSPDGNQTVTPERRIRVVAAEQINPRQQTSAAPPNESPNRQQDNQPQLQNPIAGDKSAAEKRNNRDLSPDKNQPSDENQQSGVEQQQNADRSGGENSQNQQQRGKDESQQSKNDRGKEGEQSQKKDKSEQSQDQQNSRQQDQQQSNDQNGGGKSQSGDKSSSQQKKSSGNQQGGKQKGSQQSGGDSGKSDSAGQKSQGNQSGDQGKQDNQGDGSNSSTSPRMGEQSKGGAQKGSRDSSLAQNDKPVPSDGSDDGSGVERILEHQQKEAGNKPGQLTNGEQREQKAQQRPGDQPANGQQRGSGQQENPQETVSADQQKEGQSGEEQSNQNQKTGQGKPTDKKSSSGGDPSDKNATNDNDKQSGKSAQTEQQGTGKERDPGDLPGKDLKAQSDKDKNKPKADPGAGSGANDESMADKKSENKEEAGSKSGEKEQGGHEDFPKGNAGSGQGDTDKHGAPSAQKAPTPSDKKPGEEKPPAERKGDAYPSSKDKHESDTNGEDGGASAGHDPRQQQGKPEDTETPGGGGGDMNAAAKQGASERSGGGGKGGGQRANQQGTGVAGEHTASDEGRGSAAESGKGEKSSGPGEDMQSDRPTGQAGSKRANSGKGSTSKPTDDGGEAGSGEHPNEQGTPPENKSPDKKAGMKEPGGAKSQGQQSGDKMGGGKQSGDRKGSEQAADQQPSEGKESGGSPAKAGQNVKNDSVNHSAGPGAGSNWDGTGTVGQSPTAADDPNLAYAKKATELALDHLKQAMKNKDGDKLLKDLGWTREEAQQFIDRQEARLRAAAKANPNDEARQKAEDALRSLGLRPVQTDRSGSGLTSDEQRGMSTGRRTSPPPEYMDQYKAFSQGVNSGSK